MSGSKAKQRPIALPKLPTQQDWNDLRKLLGLDPSQLQLLRHATRAAIKAIDAVNNAPKLKEQLRESTQLRKAMFELRKAVHPRKAHFRSILDLKTLETVGRLFSLPAIARTTDDRYAQEVVTQAVEKPTTLAGLETFFELAHGGIGIKHTQSMLYNIACELLADLDHKIKTVKQTLGRPRNAAREIIVLQLAEAYPDMFGKSPSASKAGMFMKLCSAVLDITYGKSNGVESFVERTLKKLKQKRGR